MKRRNLFFLFGLLLIALWVGGASSECSDGSATANRERQMTEQMTGEALSAVGFPAIHNWQEKRMVKMLYELRDTEISTITYIVDFNGRRLKLCDSVGYGIPFAAQYSAPEVVYDSVHGVMGRPQPEPNGLYMPSSADSTWVMCLNKKDKKVHPVYVEPRIIVSPFPLD